MFDRDLIIINRSDGHLVFEDLDFRGASRSRAEIETNPL